MLKNKLSKRQKDRILKKAVEEHMNEIKIYESNQLKNEQARPSPIDVGSSSSTYENVDCMSDSFVELYSNSTSDNDFDDNSFDMKVESNLKEQFNLTEELKTCFIKHKVTHDFINDLLGILRKHHDLPKDARTLLGTPLNVDTKNLNDGQYVHFGIRHGLEQLKLCFDDLDTIMLSFNIDGLPLFKSSSQQIWPILCLVDNVPISKPFVVGIFLGNAKPGNISEYLGDFIKDVKELLQNPVIDDKIYKILIHAFICDAPARSYLKCIKNHNGYFGCERCIQRGKWLGRMTFSELDSPKRKDEDFLHGINTDSSDEHIVGISPLIDINIGLVSMFPLDYMHLVCLGVVRKLISIWYKGPLPFRLSGSARQSLNTNLLACAKYSPSEFQRKPRALTDIDRWKATEFRSFLLYTGPVVLKDMLRKDYFNHFLCLHVAIRILLCDKLIPEYLDYAEQLLHYFVKHSKTLYGEEFIVYNVHSLVHLVDDVRRFGTLNKISAFPFESYLGRLKKLLRTPHKPLQQICKRLVENKHSRKDTKTEKHSLIPLSSSLHFSGPTLNCQGMQYKEIKGYNFTLKNKLADNCIMLKNHRIILVENFIYKDSELFILGKEFLHKVNFYNAPCNSSSFEIYNVSCLSPLNCWSANEFLYKGILLPYKESHVFLPLLHCYDNFF